MSLIHRKLSIPKQWTPEEALSIVAFLEDIITNIWMIHGHAMEKCFQRAERLLNSAGPVRHSLLDPFSKGSDHSVTDPSYDSLK